MIYVQELTDFEPKHLPKWLKVGEQRSRKCGDSSVIRSRTSQLAECQRTAWLQQQMVLGSFFAHTGKPGNPSARVSLEIPLHGLAQGLNGRSTILFYFFLEHFDVQSVMANLARQLEFLPWPALVTDCHLWEEINCFLLRLLLVMVFSECTEIRCTYRYQVNR